MKIALCAIAKHENNYIEEWINHHIDKYEIDHIYIYDNNENDYEYVGNRIIKNKDKVTIIKWNNFNEQSFRIQWDAYTDCWNKNKENYDWIGFWDIDEFLVIYNNDTLKQRLLSKTIFKKATTIRLHQLSYTDSNIIDRNILIPVMDSFNCPIDKCSQNKSLYNCHIYDQNYIENHGYDKGLILNINGEIVRPKNRLTIKNTRKRFNGGRLNHYRTKSLNEYIEKIKSHYNGIFLDIKSSVINNAIEYYFQTNEKTPEKIKYLKEYLNEQLTN